MFAVDGHIIQMSKSQRIKDVIQLCLKLLIYKYVVENPTIAIVVPIGQNRHHTHTHTYIAP